MSENRNLFSQFPGVSDQEWMDKVIADLKGADFDKKLVWKSKEGINVEPYYREDDIKDLSHINSLPGEFPYVRGKERLRNTWYIRQNIVVEDATKANKKALEILNRGVDSIGFIFSPEAVFNADLLGPLLDGIFIESIELNLYPQGSAIELLEALRAVIRERGIKPEKVKGAIEADPLGKYMVNGKLCVPIEDGIRYLKKFTDVATDFPNLRLVRVNGANFSNAGSTIVQELAMTLSMGNEYLSRLSDEGIDAGTFAQKLGFTFGIGSNYFFEIAKLRAARMLWATIVRKHGAEEKESTLMDIHGVSSDFNKTIYDPYVNMLRTQTEAMSATLGGVDSLTINPFNSVFAESNEFGERIARNQQLLLKEEAHFDKIVDPGAGSYYIEKLTAMIAEKAWDLFIEIEDKGGFLAALKTGFIQDKVESAASARNKKIAGGREKLLGTNIYPNLTEEWTEKRLAKTLPDEDTEIKPLNIYRAAELFEDLRYATDSSSKEVKVFMLTIGNIVMRKARAQFSSNFFSVAGYKIFDNIGFETAKEGVESALKLKADIVVICSSDEEYEIVVPQVYDALKDKAIVVVAGAPACEENLREKGVEHFISMRSDLLSTLQHFNKVLGITG